MSPALALILIPDGLVLSLLHGVGPSLMLALAWVVAFGSAHAARSVAESMSRRTTALLRPKALQRTAASLPSPVEMHAHLCALLQSEPPYGNTMGSFEPQTPEYALRSALERILASWNRAGLADLQLAELQELWLFSQLMRATPDRAGALAQTFFKPDVVLDIRDRVAEIDRRRTAYTRQITAFEASCRLWEGGTRHRSLLDQLRALEAPDLDLWHHVIAHHDPRDPAQSAAALWCARHPGCDRASVAHFIARNAREGIIEAAAELGDAEWLAGLRDVIEGWNAGRYSLRELGPTPLEYIAEAGPAFNRAMIHVAEITRSGRWRDPRGMFVPHLGRQPYARANWDLGRGGMVQAPQIVDYLDPQDLAAA